MLVLLVGIESKSVPIFTFFSQSKGLSVGWLHRGEDMRLTQHRNWVNVTLL